MTKQQDKSKGGTGASKKSVAAPVEPPLTIERLMKAWSCSKEEAQWLLDQAQKAKAMPDPKKAEKVAEEPAD